MAEGAVPAPTDRPALSVMKTYYLFKGYRIGGATAAGGEPP
jgi:hypothetical protein